jgi:hypothetical protein
VVKLLDTCSTYSICTEFLNGFNLKYLNICTLMHGLRIPQTRGNKRTGTNCNNPPCRAQILNPLTGVQVSCEVGLKSTQAWGCPCSMHKIPILRSKVSQPPFPFPLPRTFTYPIVCFIFLGKRSSTFVVVRKVDHEIR